jgi:hypothetical protein
VKNRGGKYGVGFADGDGIAARDFRRSNYKIPDCQQTPFGIESIP